MSHFSPILYNLSKPLAKIQKYVSLTKAEGNELLLLKNNSKLYIKETRNGGCVVLVNKLNYKKRVFQHLNSAIFFNQPSYKPFMSRVDPELT